jgi:hypothetical protein
MRLQRVRRGVRERERGIDAGGVSRAKTRDAQGHRLGLARASAAMTCRLPRSNATIRSRALESPVFPRPRFVA